MIDRTQITPALMVKNEAYWIHYVLRDLLKVFPKVIMLDTGSTDSTKVIAKGTERLVRRGVLELIEEDYGSDGFKIGNGRNILREKCLTYWMFLVDGDEIWQQERLHALLAQDLSDEARVVMLVVRNVEDVDGVLKLRVSDDAHMDRLFSPDIKWHRTDYPFESYGLSNTFPQDNVGYVSGSLAYAYHMRHTLRSPHNFNAFFRKEKLGYYPYEGEYKALPEKWLGAISAYPNPYL